MADGKQTLADVLRATKVGDLPRVPEVVTISSTETVTDGFKKLTDHHILSAPVWDEAAKEYTGFLDVRDLVSFVVFIDDEKNADVPDDLNALIGHGARYFKLPIENVTPTYMSRRNRFHPVKETDSLFEVAKILEGRHVHRVPVLGEDGKVVNIVSQSTLASVLQKHAGECSDSKVTIKDAEIGTAPVVSVPQDTKAIDVFRLMDNRKLSGIAVVGEDGRLVGNTSGSDLKLFLKSMEINVTEQPIFDYLKSIRVEQVDIRSTTFTADEAGTVAFVIAKFAATRAHRIFVASDAHGYVPEKVISISDVLKWVLHHDE